MNKKILNTLFFIVGTAVLFLIIRSANVPQSAHAITVTILAVAIFVYIAITKKYKNIYDMAKNKTSFSLFLGGVFLFFLSLGWMYINEPPFPEYVIFLPAVGFALMIGSKFSR